MISVYPVFEINSIKERFKNDINKFNNNNLKNIDISSYIKEIDDFKTDDFNITKFKEEISTKITAITNNYNTFNYSHDIIRFDPNQQSKLWCIRTVLFCKLLIVALEMMKIKDFFVNVYNNNNNNEYKRNFNEIVVGELPFYKLGIFGSMTPISDIDVGIQYSGKKSDLIGLSYIVSIIEDLFIILTGKNSLEFDIELYADMMTLPNFDENTKTQYEDIFYLDTTTFEETDFDKLLPYIEASILRNYVTVKKNENNNNISEILKTFKVDDLLSIINKKKNDSNENDSNENDSNRRYNNIKIKLLPNTTLFQRKPKSLFSFMSNSNDDSKELIIDYMSKSYDEARTRYYELVDIAEKSLKDVRYQNLNNNSIINLTNDKIIEIMKKIAHALVYRAESYTCAPTVMHVVRVLQANKDNPTKYINIAPGYCATQKSIDAYCNIGKYGYLMSMYEQIGNIYRFHLNYCIEDSNYNKEKCNEKYDKYNKRFIKAIESIEKNINTQTGGKKSTIKKRTKKQNRTKRNSKLFKKLKRRVSKNKK